MYIYNMKENKVLEEKVIKLVQLNKNNIEICSTLSISYSLLKKIKQKLKIQNFRNVKLENEFLQFKQMYPNIPNTQLSEMMQCSKALICKLNKKHNLPSNNKNGVSHKNGKFQVNYGQSKNTDCKLNLYQISVLVGTIMGDASLRISSKTSGRGSFNHIIENKDYVTLKKNILYPIISGQSIITPKMKNSNPQICTRFKSCPLLKDIYKKIYTNSKRITPFILSHFTDASLAMYYMDDGYKKDKTYVITMYSFSEKEKKSLSNLLFLKWGIESTVQKHVLYIKQKSKEKFKYLIKPYITNSMRYKL